MQGEQGGPGGSGQTTQASGPCWRVLGRAVRRPEYSGRRVLAALGSTCGGWVGEGRRGFSGLGTQSPRPGQMTPLASGRRQSEGTG